MSHRTLAVCLFLAAASVVWGQPPRRLPREFTLAPDFRNVGLARAQGERDVCSLFALTALAEFEEGKDNPHAHAKLSEEFLIWAANQATGRTGDQAMFYEAVHGLNALGICREQLMPYLTTSGAGREPTPSAMLDAKQRSGRWKTHWIRRWDTKRSLSDDDLVAIKEALASHHPVACGLRWPRSVSGNEILAVPPPDQVFDGHSVALIGYQDNPRQPGGGAFLFRNSQGPKWGTAGNGTLSYAYARAYANDALWLELLPSMGRQAPVRWEAESLTVIGRDHCETNSQNMDAFGFGMWSQGKQLFCRSSLRGFVELSLDITDAGRYRVSVLATAGPDFGIVRATLDDQRIKPDFDLYSGRVSPWGAMDLGILDLAAGSHR